MGNCLNIFINRIYLEKIYQDNNEIIIEVLEGKIQKVYEKEPKPKNGNWSVYRIGRDTLVSSAKINDKSYFKKYYIDTVIIKLKSNYITCRVGIHIEIDCLNILKG